MCCFGDVLFGVAFVCVVLWCLCLALMSVCSVLLVLCGALLVDVC